MPLALEHNMAQIKKEQKKLFIVMFINLFYIIEIVSFNLYPYKRIHMHQIVCINLIIKNLFKKDKKIMKQNLSQKENCHLGDTKMLFLSLDCKNRMNVDANQQRNSKC